MSIAQWVILSSRGAAAIIGQAFDYIEDLMKILAILAYYYPHWTGLTVHAVRVAWSQGDRTDPAPPPGSRPRRDPQWRAGDPPAAGWSDQPRDDHTRVSVCCGKA